MRGDGFSSERAPLKSRRPVGWMFFFWIFHFSSLHEFVYVVYVLMCSHTHGCLCVCTFMWRSRDDVQTLSRLLSTRLFKDRTSQSNTEHADTIVSLACSEDPMSVFWDWNYRWVAMPRWHLCGFWGSKLQSSCLQGGLFTCWAIPSLQPYVEFFKHFSFFGKPLLRAISFAHCVLLLCIHDQDPLKCILLITIVIFLALVNIWSISFLFHHSRQLTRAFCI